MATGLSVSQSVAGAFVLALLLAALHLLAPGNEAVGQALGDVVEPTPLFGVAIFSVALAGFTAFYGLERLADAHPESADVSQGRFAGSIPGSSAGVYALHLGSFLTYNAVITYTMALRLRTGVDFALLFTVAMGLHFVLTDRGLEEHYPHRFNLRGRLTLAGALVLGWALAALFAPSSAVFVALLTALLGGSILLNVFKEEIPSNRDSSFVWFLVGLTVYSVLLALVTAAAE